jgi:hypothetical protein
MIVLGADVGKATGLCLLDCSGQRPRYISAGDISASLPRVLRDIFHEHAVAIIGIESPKQVFAHGRASESEGARVGIERNLLISTRATGAICAVAALFAAEVPIFEGEAHEVRRAVLGALPKKREDIDRLVGVMVPRLIDGWPARSNDHERDAAVAALWAWRRHMMPAALRPIAAARPRRRKP